MDRERERWAIISQAISDVDQRWHDSARDTHPTARIVRVYLWAASHDRPVCWACVADNWTLPQTRPDRLPDQSCMSRRTRREDFERFLVLVGKRLNGKASTSSSKAPAALVALAALAVPAALVSVRKVDGKPLELPNHTTDRDAAWGRGVSRTSVGYKLHAITTAGRPMPDAFAITPLDVCEKRMAKRMLKRLSRAGAGAGSGSGSCGYLLADSHYDASWLHDEMRLQHNCQLVCPRAKPNTGLGHRYQSPHRQRAIHMLELPANLNTFGSGLHAQRGEIERDFAHLCTFGGGLAALPSWVRRIWRVRTWVIAKLLINAARIRLLMRTKAG